MSYKMFELAFVAAVIIGLVLGGKFKNLSRLEFKYIYLVFAAFLIQLGIDLLAPRQPWGGYPYLHIFSYGLLFFTMIKNRHLPGMYFILAGTALNFVVIALNGGQMPVRPDVIPRDMAEVMAAGGGGTHGLLLENTRLGFLGDILYVSLPYQKQLISVGDLVIDVGLLIFIIQGMKGYPANVRHYNTTSSG